jgi:hypothetical protein
MNLLIHPTYFPSISHFVAMVKAESITFEAEDNFQSRPTVTACTFIAQMVRSCLTYL